MKKSAIILAAIASTSGSILLTSCDGGSSTNDLTVAERDALTAESFEPQEISQGDQIFWNPSDNSAPIIDQVVLSSFGSVAQLGIIFEYRKTGDHTFNITTAQQTPPPQAITIALTNTLTDRAGAVLGNRLRTLLHRDQPNFTTAELEEIRDILNPSGAQLTTTDSGDLVVTETSTYRHLVTSTNGEQFRGTMGGTYDVTANATKIEFRRPTAAERAVFRLIDENNDWIPAVGTSSDSFLPDETLEQGRWQLDLVNNNN